LITAIVTPDVNGKKLSVNIAIRTAELPQGILKKPFGIAAAHS
jgi:hypothetical protein